MWKRKGFAWYDFQLESRDALSLTTPESKENYALSFLAENLIYKLNTTKFINRAGELCEKLADCLPLYDVNNSAENWSEVNWDDACIVNIRKTVSRKKKILA